VQVTSPDLDSLSRQRRPIALVQLTDLGVHARIGSRDGVVWVTGASDGRPRGGAAVTLYDEHGRELTRSVTDTSGLARLRFQPPAGDDTTGTARDWSGFEGYVRVTLGDDQARLGISDYDPDLSPWRFNVSQAYGAERLPVAAAVVRLDVAEPRPEAGAQVPSVPQQVAAHPSVVAGRPWAGRPPWLAPRQVERSAHAMRKSRTASPSRRLWRAAGCGGLS